VRIPTFIRTSALAGTMLLSGPAAALPESVTRLIQANGIPADSISVVMKRVGAPKALINHQPTVPRNPASVMKLVTTATALNLLGPKHRWQTDALILGHFQGDTLTGDLSLRGGGDPWLVIERFWLLVRQLRERGLTHIRGDLVLDDSLFDRSAIRTEAIDGKSRRSYNTPPNALLVNFGATSLKLDSRMSRLSVIADPPATTVHLTNTVKLDNRSCTGRARRITLNVDEHQAHTGVLIGGTYPINCGQSILRRTLLPHGQYVYGVFKALWQESGGTLSGNWRYGKTPAQATILGQLDSVSLAEVIRYTNKFSNNVMARNLLLTLASEFAPKPATPAKGAQIIHDWLNAVNIAMPNLLIDNGAGLSRDARVTAEGLATLLEAATTLPWWPEFIGSLPIATVDGSLHRRFHGIARPGRLRLKTGLLRGVRTLAGYAIDPAGDTWVVVILHNHARATEPIGIKIQHQLLQTLFENHPRETN
tara:strand:- start:6671 stop:8107 length:1437 start_codon:yes stop_codon:yes gene_type:complete